MNKNEKKALIIVPLLGVLFFLFSGYANALQYTDPAACTVNWEFEPGLIPSNWRTLNGFLYNNSPAEFIGWLFTVALGFAGFLSLIMIVVAGIEYTASQGNSGAQSRSKERIQNALLGLGLLIISFVLLNTINPSLTRIKNPTLSTQYVGIPSAQICTCNYKTTKPGYLTCTTYNPCVNASGDKTGTCSSKVVHSSDSGNETEFSCCKFSDPPPPVSGPSSGGPDPSEPPSPSDLCGPPPNCIYCEAINYPMDQCSTKPGCSPVLDPGGDRSRNTCASTPPGAVCEVPPAPGAGNRDTCNLCNQVQCESRRGVCAWIELPGETYCAPF